MKTNLKALIPLVSMAVFSLTACLDQTKTAADVETDAITAARQQCEAVLSEDQSACDEIVESFSVCVNENCSAEFDQKLLTKLVELYGDAEGNLVLEIRKTEFESKSEDLTEEVLQQHKEDFMEHCLEHKTQEECDVIAAEYQEKLIKKESCEELIDKVLEKPEISEEDKLRHEFYEVCLEEGLTSEECIAMKPAVVKCVDELEVEETEGVETEEVEMDSTKAKCFEEVIANPPVIEIPEITKEQLKSKIWNICTEKEIPEADCLLIKEEAVACAFDGETVDVNPEVAHECIDKALENNKPEEVEAEIEVEVEVEA